MAAASETDCGMKLQRTVSRAPKLQNKQFGYQRGSKATPLMKSLRVAHRAARLAIPAIRNIVAKDPTAAGTDMRSIVMEVKPWCRDKTVKDQRRLRLDSDTTASEGSEWMGNTFDAADQIQMEELELSENSADQMVELQEPEPFPDEEQEEDTGDECLNSSSEATSEEEDGWEVVSVSSLDTCESYGVWEMAESDAGHSLD